MEITKRLIPELNELKKSLDKKSKEFDNIIKIGRTHLQDATPITLGQEFSGYAKMIEHSISRINSNPTIFISISTRWYSSRYRY